MLIKLLDNNEIMIQRKVYNSKGIFPDKLNIKIIIAESLKLL